MVVVLAFVILGLAVFVAVVLVGRFNSSMMRAVEESQHVDSIEAPRGRLAEVAFMVGVNNMKRRRIRTTLTCLTIVLVTFTMLSVISVGHDVDPVRLRVAREAPYDGFIYGRPGLGPIDSSQMQRLKAHFDRNATAVARIWVERLGPIGEYLNYELRPVQPIAGARVKSLEAKILLGLDVAEQGFVTQMPLMPGGAWFSSNDAKEVILSVEMAGLLGITPQNFTGREILIGDHRLKLIGLMDDQRLRELKDLGEVPLLPMMTQITEARYSERRAAALRQTQDEASGRARLGAGGGSLVSDPNTRPAEPLDVAFVPIGFARSLGDGDYRTLSVKYRPVEGNGAKSAAQRAWDAANRLIRFQHTRVTVGLRDPIVADKDSPNVAAGQYAMASSSSSEVGGVLKIAIPIIIIATIIFNTMLGSVMERKREVSIYNAIGLNPGHVMMFFLAESFVYGIIGSVAGYLIGQGLSLVVAQTIGLNLNYSSLSVIFVIFLSIGTVLLSTIYPAVMAARAAVPSGQRKWSIPQPVGDQIYVKFPFSYDAGRVLGACCYLYEFMQQNSEASTGKFLAQIGPVGLVPSPAGTDGEGTKHKTAFA
ncbi:MAG: FtsX-like permease family protein, partial [Phycisphaerae bacterium]|nr:FtsX-like permease family protein [Phycisphaerae bacterium]